MTSIVETLRTTAPQLELARLPALAELLLKASDLLAKRPEHDPRLDWIRDYEKSLNERARVEQELLNCANGKTSLPDAEQCRKWALRLGVPEGWRRGTPLEDELAQEKKYSAFLKSTCIELRDEINKLNADRSNMGLFISRLVHRLKAARDGQATKAGDDDLAGKALDYLVRNGLISPLRDVTAPEDK